MPIVPDRFGAMALDVAVPEPGDVVADPFLKYSLAYFQAFINAHGQAAYETVAPSGNTLPIKTTHPHDPLEQSFLERDLPCLYMWRAEGVAQERIAEDLFASHTRVHCLWVMPPMPEEKQKNRVPFVNAITKLLLSAIEFGRDRSWILLEDTDPLSATYDAQAATNGSVYPRKAGFSKLTMSKWVRKSFVIENTDAREKYAFPALESVLDVEEILDESLDKYDEIGGVDVTETTEDKLVVTDHALFT